VIPGKPKIAGWQRQSLKTRTRDRSAFATRPWLRGHSRVTHLRKKRRVDVHYNRTCSAKVFLLMTMSRKSLRGLPASLLAVDPTPMRLWEVNYADADAFLGPKLKTTPASHFLARKARAGGPAPDDQPSANSNTGPSAAPPQLQPDILSGVQQVQLKHMHFITTIAPPLSGIFVASRLK
jgi:hypothetical protein